MQPPRLAAIAHGKLSSRTCPKAAVLEPKGSATTPPHPVPLSRSLDAALLASTGPIHLVFLARHGCLVREISTQFDCHPKSHGSQFDLRLESPANMHTAADLHVHLVSKTALVLKIVGAASHLRNTQCSGTRNQIDPAAAASLRARSETSLRVKKASF